MPKAARRATATISPACSPPKLSQRLRPAASPLLAQGLVDTTQTGYDAQHLAPAVLTSDVTATRVDQLGNRTVDKLDRFGNVVAEIDPLGNVTTYVRDANGWVTSMTAPGPERSADHRLPLRLRKAA